MNEKIDRLMDTNLGRGGEMSDCRVPRREYDVPDRFHREPGVIYMHAVYTHETYANAKAIVVSGVRFERASHDQTNEGEGK